MEMLRWLKKLNGNIVLQQEVSHNKVFDSPEWEDVPMVIEEQPDTEYCIAGGPGYVMSVQKGLGKARVAYAVHKINAKKFNTDLECRIFMEQNNLSLHDHDIETR